MNHNLSSNTQKKTIKANLNRGEEGVNAYGQPDRKLSVFFMTCLLIYRGQIMVTPDWSIKGANFFLMVKNLSNVNYQ